MRKIYLLFFVCSLFAFELNAQTYNMSNLSVTDVSGTLYDSGGPGGNYGNFQLFTFTICPSGGAACIALNFSSFATEAGFDFLTVYDGPNAFSPQVGSFTGTAVPPTVFASSGCMTITFASDFSGTAAGWEANWTTLASCPTPINIFNGSTTNCTGILYDSGGPGGNYSDNENFVYTICSPNPDQCISLSSGGFDLESCCDDLNLYNGNSTAAPLIGNYAGTTGPNGVTSMGPCMTIEFTSDGSVTGAGFQLTWSCFDCVCTASCSGGPPPSNDDCTEPVNLGTLPAPSDCLFGNGQGSPTTFMGSNLCATPANPYTSILGCASGGDMASPALDVWYQFTITGSELEITIDNGMTDPNVGLWQDSGAGCGTLIPVGCSVGSNGFLNETFGPLNSGLYYLQVSGGDATDECTFNLTLQNNDDCNVCLTEQELDINPPPVGGEYGPGEAVEFCYTVSDYNQTNTNWLHGVAPNFGPGWDLSTLTWGPPPPSCSGGGTWGVYTSVTSCITGITAGPGFFYETTGSSCGGSDPNDPGDNYGDAGVASGLFGCSLEFCWTISTLPAGSCIDGESLSMTVETYSDSETGGWNSFACGTDPDFNFLATLSCCPIPVLNPLTPISVCPGLATTITATGTNIATYSWSTGDMGPTITVSPTVTTTYTVTIDNGCGMTLMESVTVDVVDFSAVMSATDADCNGAATGSIDLTLTGGTTPFTYTWSGPTAIGSSVEDPTNLAAGNYTVLVEDANMCQAMANVTVGEPSAITVMTSVVNEPLCAGEASGEATATGSGGVPSYTYNWSSGGNMQNETGLMAGTYTVTITDASGCTNTTNVTLTDPTAMTASIDASTNPVCAGGSDGQATVTASGGDSNYTYNWSSGGNAATETGLMGNISYAVTVTDGNGCTATAGITLAEPAAMTASIDMSNPPSCASGSDGDATVTPGGGDGSYAYNWSSGGNAATETGLMANISYTVTVTDGNNCTATAAITLTEPTAMTASISATNDPLCAGANDGDATALAMGGDGNYTYNWSSGGNAAMETGLMAGQTYTVTVTDGSGCLATATTTLNEPPVLNIAIDGTTDATCGNADGDATVLASGGSPTYSFTWGTTPVQNGTTASGLAAGSYAVTVTDNNGCTTAITVPVSDAGSPVIDNTSFTDATCGNSDGEVAAIVSGGVAPLTYAWNTTPPQNTPTASNVPAGTYTIVVTDANNCAVSETVNVADLAGPIIDNTSFMDATCGNSNGEASVTAVSGGTPPYTYEWNTTPIQTTQTATAIPMGSYTVIVTDDNNCTAMTTVNVADAGLPTIDNTASVDATCGNANGEASITAVSGGTPPYTYEWNTTPIQTTQAATGIPMGSYTVIVTDDNACTVMTTVNVADGGLPTIDNTAFVDATCGNTDGEASVTTVSGGTPPYTYSWNTTPPQTTQTATGIPSGAYTVIVTDDNNCTAMATVNVADAGSPMIDSTPTVDANCGNADGEMSVTASGGTPPYTYEWNTTPVQNTQTATGVLAGTYTILVTDDNGCAISTTVTVSDAGSPVIDSTPTVDANCGNADGEMSVTASGGTPPYTYEWNTTPIQNTQTATGIPAGTYTIVVTDDNGCTVMQTVTVADAGAPVIDSTPTIDSNCGNADGEMSVTASGGTPPYTYEWNTTPVQNTQTATGIPAGTYTIVVTDDNGCTVSSTATVTDAAAPTIDSTTPTDATCGNADGTASVTASGGMMPYTYEWNTTPIQNTQTATGIPAGTYTVIVTDQNNCTATTTVNVADAGSPTIDNVSVVDSNCGNSDGELSVVVSGGMMPYTFEWNTTPVQNTQTATGVPAGTYTILVTDANNCIVSTTATISDAGSPMIDSFSAVEANCGNADGEATVIASGGMMPYTYEWNTIPIQNTQTATGISAGTYTAIVTDANNCTVEQTLTVAENDAPVAMVTTSLENCEATDGSATVNVTGGVAPYTYSWNTTPVQNTQMAIDLPAGSYDILVTDMNGCTAIATAVVNGTERPTVTIAPLNSTCGELNGEATANVSGGVAPYDFSWSTTPVQTGQTATDLAAGSYQVLITDANGCTVIGVAGISDEGAPVANIDFTAPNCGDANGEATADVSGGVAPYTYNWNTTPVQNTQTATGLIAGTYQVNIEDANGCVLSESVTLNDPGAPDASLTTVPSTCGNANGEATVEVVGGSAPYTYEWNTAPIQNTQTATALMPGTYTVVVTDDNGCSDTMDAVITDNPAPQLSGGTPVAAHCGNSDGEVAGISISGGAAPILYEWTDDNTGFVLGTDLNIVNLQAGSYSLLATDANGCTATTSFTIADEPAPSITNGTVAHAHCGQNDGGVLGINISGGNAPFTYEWTNNDTGIVESTNQELEDVVTGNYTLVVTDINGCMADASFVILDELGPELSGGTPVNSNCSNADGSITGISVSGGTSPFSYEWINNGTMAVVATDLNLANVLAGDYTLNVTDNNGCFAALSFNISDAPAPQLSGGNIANTTCNEANGAISGVTITDGTAPFSFEWFDNGGVLVGTAIDLTNVAAGNYSLVVTDDNGCEANMTLNIDAETPPQFMPGTVNSASCGDDNGSIVGIVITDGSGTITYNWTDESMINVGNDLDLENVPAGSYTLSFSDENGCGDAFSFTINDLPPPQLSNGTAINASCGNADGAINGVTVTGGTGTIAYSWTDDIGGVVGLSLDLNGVASGTYTLTATDENMCAATITIAVGDADGPQVSGGIVTNASCGQTDGAILGATATGGTAPLIYTWTNASGTAIDFDENLDNAAAGTYTLTVLDDNGCEGSLVLTINEIPGPQLTTATILDASCGQSDGEISGMNVIDGTAPFIFEWTDASMGSVGADLDLTGVPAGDYTLLVTDNNGCTTSTTATIADLAGPQISGGTASPSSCGNADGSITSISVTGGETPYTYEWTDNIAVIVGTDIDLGGVVAGTYTLLVIDANGCTSTADLAVNDAGAPELSGGTVSDASCGQSDGAYSGITTTGGMAPYTYEWTNDLGDVVGSTADLSGVPAGMYEVEVLDNNNCAANLSITINDSDAPSIADGLVTNASCGNDDGGVSGVLVTGGTAPYNYSWSNGTMEVGTNPDLSGVVAGTYTLAISDQNGCATTLAYTINDLGGPTASGGTVLNANCGNEDGSITSILVENGTAPYTYEWQNAATDIVGTNADLMGVASGDYTVFINDMNGCMTSLSFTILENDAPVASGGTVLNANCGNEDGSISGILVENGTAPYTYEWQNAATDIVGTNTDLMGVASGDYTVFINDMNGCMTSLSFTILENDAPVASGGTVLNANCGNEDGSISGILVENGTAPYTYEWQNAATDIVGTNADLVGVASGDYTVFINDLNGCVASLSFTIVNNAGPTLSGGDVTNTSCGNADGAIENVVVMGGTTPFVYEWTQGGVFLTNDENLIGIGSGSYTLNVTDLNGCTESISISVGDADGPQLAGGVVVATTCGDANGNISGIVASGGTPPLAFEWIDNLGNVVDMDIDLDAVAAGDYTLNVTDVNGCAGALAFIIPDQVGPTLSGGTVADASCGNADGSILGIIITGGTAPISYEWTDGTNTVGDNSIDLNNVVAGSYTLTATDNNGCIETIDFMINDLGAPVLDGGVVQNATCGDANGAISGVTITGGIDPITYEWTNIADGSILGNSIDLPNSIEGDILLTATDANGCVASLSFLIENETGPILADGTVIDATCGDANGEVNSITIAGGTDPIMYEWTDATGLVLGTDIDLVGFEGGDINLTATDANGCTASLNFTINNADAPILSGGEITSATCGQSNGAILNVIETGGTAPFIYEWTNELGDVVGTNMDLTGVPAGIFDCLTTDANGCTDVISFTVPDIAGPELANAIVTNASCGNADGMIEGITTTNGTAPFTYEWTNEMAIVVGTAIDLAGQPAGTYLLTATDINGCVETLSVSIANQDGPELSDGTVTDTNCGSEDGAVIDVTVINGAAPYTFEWLDASTAFVANTEDLTGVVAGDYTLNVTDMNGCVGTLSFTIADNPAQTLSGGDIAAASCDQSDGSISGVIITGGAAPYVYEWTEVGNPTILGTDPDLTGVPSGEYEILVTDVNGCEASLSYIIPDIAGPQFVIDAGDVFPASCGNADGSILGVMPFDGTMPYTYEWTNDVSGMVVGTDLDLTSVPAGNYRLVLTDANGCQIDVLFIVPDADGPQLADGTITAASCGQSDGGVSAVSVSNGTAPYTYEWSDGISIVSTDADLVNFPAGDYTLTVIDVNGCTAALAFIIPNLDGPTLSIDAITTATCGTDDGTASVIITNGTAPYTYEWDFDPLLNAPSANNLFPGTYEVMVTDANGCISTITIDVPGAIETPIVDCGDITTESIEFTWTAVSGAVEYEVSINGNTPIIVPATDLSILQDGLAENENVTIEVTAIGPAVCGNSATATTNCTTLEIECPPIEAIIDGLAATYCSIDAPVTLTGTPLGGTFSGDGVTGNTFDPTAVGEGIFTITYEGLDQDDCPYETVQTVEVIAQPTADFVPPSTICIGDEASFTFTGTASTTATFSWNFGTGASPSTLTGIGPHNVVFNTAGIQQVTLTVTNGNCTHSITQEVSVSQVTVNTIGNTIVDAGLQMQLNTTANSTVGSELTFEWMASVGGMDCPDCQSPIVTINEPTTYTVIATDEFGCAATASVIINTFTINKVIVPNAFSPNDDGVNDVFRVLGENVAAVELIIYNRWGEQVFIGDGLTGWDGIYKGQIMELGTFVYHAFVTFTNGEEESLRGNVTLIH